jgi:Raf kinase inhibitor-like YbhB/YbcL family protein
MTSKRDQIQKLLNRPGTFLPTYPCASDFAIYGVCFFSSDEVISVNFAISDMQLTSPAFGEGERIPAKHTGEGDDVSPALAWADVPEGTESFALICHDPDAPVVSPGAYGFVHWVLYNIPGSVSSLPEAVSDYTVGSNDFGTDKAYGGPMPPEGHGTHRYFFWLFALRSKPDLEPGLSLWDLMRKIEADVIGMNRLVGNYSRG